MIAALMGVLCFGLLALLNLRIGRSITYPGVVLASVWALEFLVQALSGRILYPVSWPALLVFVIGCLAFTAGAVVGNGGVGTRLPPQAPVPVYLSDRLVLWGGLMVLALGLLAYIAHVRTLTSAPLFSPRFFYEVRHAGIAQAAVRNRVPLINNLVPFSMIGAMIAYAVTDAGRRWRILVWSFIALSLIYNLMTGAKVGLVTLAVALMGIHMILRRHVSIRVVLVGFVAIFVLFGIVTYGRMGSGDLFTAVKQGWAELVAYFAISPVGFSLYLDDPSLVPAVWSPWYFFMRTVNYLAPVFSIPSIHAQFLEVGPDAMYNTYTAYFAYYPSYGIGGVVAFMAFIGAACAWIHRRALRGGLVWVLLYSILIYGLLMSIFNESLLWDLNFDLKLVLVTLVFVSTRRLAVLQHLARFLATRPKGSRRTGNAGHL